MAGSEQLWEKADSLHFFWFFSLILFLTIYCLDKRHAKNLRKNKIKRKNPPNFFTSFRDQSGTRHKVMLFKVQLSPSLSLSPFFLPLILLRSFSFFRFRSLFLFPFLFLYLFKVHLSLTFSQFVYISFSIQTSLNFLKLLLFYSITLKKNFKVIYLQICNLSSVFINWKTFKHKNVI